MRPREIAGVALGTLAVVAVGFGFYQLVATRRELARLRAGAAVTAPQAAPPPFAAPVVPAIVPAAPAPVAPSPAAPVSPAAGGAMVGGPPAGGMMAGLVAEVRQSVNPAGSPAIGVIPDAVERVDAILARSSLFAPD